MDLLGSIMSAMDKPPSLSESEKLLRKKRKEEFERRQKEDKERYAKFKERIEAKISSHFNNSENTALKFEPMDHVYRSIVHEVAEALGLISYGFGEEGIDRYVQIYRAENPPSEDELAARRRGEDWNEEIKERLQRKRELEKQEEEEMRKRPKKIVPNSNYKDKYAHLIGHEAAVQAARKTETNKSYGFVPSENKKDNRSIEQTMADIKAKKMLKQNQSTSNASSS